MRKQAVVAIIFLTSILSFGQGFSYGVTYGQGFGDDLNYSAAIELNYYFFDIGDDFQFGLATAGTLRDIQFGSSDSNPDGFSDSFFYADVGIAARYYLSDLLKANLDVGYSFVGSQEIGNLIFIKPYLELDLDSISIISGPSLSFGDGYNFTSFNLGIRFKDLY